MGNYHGIDRMAVVPARFRHLRVERHPSYGDHFAGIEVVAPGGILSLLQEDRADGAFLLTLLTQATESPKTWHGTGNPYPLKELWSAPVRLPRAAPIGPTWTLPIFDELCRDLGLSIRHWNRTPFGGLQQSELVQNRWFCASLEIVVGWLERRLEVSDVIGIEGRVPVPAVGSDARYRKGPAVYLTTSDDLPAWVKLGKADTKESPVTRLFKQQCCSPRQLRHIRVWRPIRGLDEPLSVVERRRFAARLRSMASENRSEWYSVSRDEALRSLDDCAQSIGFIVAYSAELPHSIEKG